MKKKYNNKLFLLLIIKRNKFNVMFIQYNRRIYISFFFLLNSTCIELNAIVFLQLKNQFNHIAEHSYVHIGNSQFHIRTHSYSLRGIASVYSMKMNSERNSSTKKASKRSTFTFNTFIFIDVCSKLKE